MAKQFLFVNNKNRNKKEKDHNLQRELQGQEYMYNKKTMFETFPRGKPSLDSFLTVISAYWMRTVIINKCTD